MRRRRPPPDGTDVPIEVTLYGRPGCHLCEQAAAMLIDIGGRIPLTMRELSIEDDDALLSRYVFAIPVILANGVEVARAPLHRAALEAALRQAASGSRNH